MSIDMTTVKEITHNNKEVVKIEDSNGNILWQKASANTIDFIVTGAGNSDYLYALITYTNSTTEKVYSETTTTLNKDEVSSIKIYHRPGSTNWYSAVLVNGSLSQSNITTTVANYSLDLTSISSKIEIDFNFSASSYTSEFPRIAYVITDNTSLNYTPVIFRAVNGSTTYLKMTLNSKNYTSSTVSRYTINDTATTTTLTYTAMSTSSSYISVITKKGIDMTITSPNTLTKLGTVDSPVYGKYKYIAGAGCRSSTSNVPSYINVTAVTR